MLCRSEWEALGPPVECMGFDFYEGAANMQPLQVPPLLALEPCMHASMLRHLETSALTAPCPHASKNSSVSFPSVLDHVGV